MAEGEPRGAAEVSAALGRHLSRLQEPGREVRLRALKAIAAELQERPVLPEVFAGQLLRPLARVVAADPAERCRELALQLAQQGLSQGADAAAALPELLPAVAQRLCPAGGQGREPCEELRLALVQLVGLLLERSRGAGLAPYLPDLVRVLQAALLDPYPEVKREACRCAAACARALPGAAELGGSEQGGREGGTGQGCMGRGGVPSRSCFMRGRVPFSASLDIRSSSLRAAGQLSSVDTKPDAFASCFFFSLKEGPTVARPF